MTDGRLLARALREPTSVLALDAAGWTALLQIARAETLIGTLAARLDGLALPHDAARILTDARASIEQQRIVALWEAEMAHRVLAPLDVPVVLLKGTAFLAAGLQAGVGRSVGDLDILVPRGRIDDVEGALLAAGWEWVKPDPYDDAYYRQWMHELPPLIHRERDRTIDVHHTILPLTARITPDADALIVASAPLSREPGALRMLAPNDMLVHAAAHLFADGDLAGGMRNLWDVHCLIEQFGIAGLTERAQHHGLWREVARAARLSHELYGTRLPDSWRTRNSIDPLYIRRVTARNGWGQRSRLATRFTFYARSHWLRMPPAMLARHLWTKWRKGSQPAG